MERIMKKNIYIIHNSRLYTATCSFTEVSMSLLENTIYKHHACQLTSSVQEETSSRADDQIMHMGLSWSGPILHLVSSFV